MRKVIERQRGARFMRIEIEVREDDPRGLADGFAVVGELYEPRGKQGGKARYLKGREADAYGAMHDEIALFAPELAPVIAVHLADPHGVPMHAVANGWYFYRGAARRYEEAHGYPQAELDDRARAAQALHIPAEELPEGLDEAGFAAFAEGLRGRWAEQAAKAREIFDALEDQA